MKNHMVKPVGGGSSATTSGTLLEAIVSQLCTVYGYDYYSFRDYDRLKVKPATKCIVKRWPYTTIYGEQGYGDGTIINERGEIIAWIEAKRQKVSGSTDEKMPYVFYNARLVWTKTAPEVFIVLQGKGFKEGAIKWIKTMSEKHNILINKPLDNGKIHVVSPGEFIDWIDQQENKKPKGLLKVAL